MQRESRDTGSETARPARAERQAYWRANLRLIAALLFVWALVSFGFSILGVEWLNRFRLGRLPLGFWFAHQGAIYVFVALIFVYAWCMDRLDRRFGDGARPETGRGAGDGEGSGPGRGGG